MLDNLRRKLNWNVGNVNLSDACTWPGVVCGFFDVIWYLSIPNLGLEGEFELNGSLTGLSRLDITNNRLTGNLSQIFRRAPGLQIVRVGSNRFSETLTTLPSNIQELDISSNEFAFDVSSIVFPSSLQFLYTDGNPGLFGTFNESLANCGIVEIYCSNVGLGELGFNLLSKGNLQIAHVPNTGSHLSPLYPFFFFFVLVSTANHEQKNKHRLQPQTTNKEM